MNKKCQVFTPENYVKELLDGVGYTHELYGKKILENSCGDGNILCCVFVTVPCQFNFHFVRKICNEMLDFFL